MRRVELRSVSCFVMIFFQIEIDKMEVSEDDFKKGISSGGSTLYQRIVVPDKMFKLGSSPKNRFLCAIQMQYFYKSINRVST